MKIIKNIMLVIYYLLGIKLSSKLGGNKLRRLITRNIFENQGKNVSIFDNVYFGNGTKISIGDNSGIGPESRLITAERITIGNDVIIGPRAMILTGNHNFSDSNIPINKQKSTALPVVIEDDVWIGANVTILPGIVIGKGAVIGAGSVLTKNVAPLTIVGGNPAKQIGMRETKANKKN